MKPRLSLLAVSLLFASAQERLLAQAPMPEYIQFAGSVSKVQGGTIGVKAATGNYLVKLDPEAADLKLSVQGTADASILQPGWDVRFEVTLDKRGIAQEEISKLEIFTYHPTTNRYGVEVPKEEGGKHFVSGKIAKLTKARDMTLTIPGGKSVKGKIAEDAEVEVNLAGPVVLKVLRAGDTVSIIGRGFPAQANAPGQVLASSIDAKLEAPLGDGTKEDKPAEDKPAEDPAADKPEKKPGDEPKDGDKPAAGKTGTEKPEKKPPTRKPPVKKAAEAEKDQA